MIQSQQVAKEIKWNIPEAMTFAADLMEDVNEHNMANVIRCMLAGKTEYAKVWIEIEELQVQAGELTPAIKILRDNLLAKMGGE